MTNLTQVVLLLLAAMVGLTIVANRIGVPEPLILVPAGVILGFIPWFPQIERDPELVLLVFLPPLVYIGGAATSWQAFQKNIGPIFHLSFGLVLFTMSLVAAAAHYIIPGLSWPVAFVLGFIVAPTDDVAAANIVRRFPIPHRIVSLLEGEGLMNDATALTAFKFASVAVILGSFSIKSASLTFFGIIFGEIGYGILLGWILAKFRQRIEDPSLGVTIALLTPYLAYLPPERMGGSGVLATAAVGLYIGSRRSSLFTSAIRLTGESVFQTLIFILNNFLFLVTGLQLKTVLGRTPNLPVSNLLFYGTLISVIVIISRMVWIYSIAIIPRALSEHIRNRDPMPPLRHLFIFSWTGIRGSISLAAALGIPVASQIGSPFPSRDLVIFITFCVILSTLVVQGISLPPLIRWLRVDHDGLRERRGAHFEESRARLEAAKTVLAQIEIWTKEGNLPFETVHHLRDRYEKKIRRLDRHQDEKSDDEFAHLSRKETAVQLQALTTERSKILALHDEKLISDQVLRLIVFDLDLQEMRLNREHGNHS
ncbi:MAG: Na+/H+ antiporter [Nitrospiria bacterium]